MPESNAAIRPPLQLLTDLLSLREAVANDAAATLADWRSGMTRHAFGPAAANLAAWLALSHGELAWFADVQSRERWAEDRRLRHYGYAWSSRPGAPVRFLEQPKAHLKALQRRILRELLVHVPAHDAAYGFVPGRDPGNPIFGMAAAVLFPVAYGLAGFVTTLIGAWLYNGLAGLVGGVEIELR